MLQIMSHHLHHPWKSTIICLSCPDDDPEYGIPLNPPAVKSQNLGIPTVNMAVLSKDSLPVFVSIPGFWLTRGGGHCATWVEGEGRADTICFGLGHGCLVDKVMIVSKNIDIRKE